MQSRALANASALRATDAAVGVAPDHVDQEAIEEIGDQRQRPTHVDNQDGAQARSLWFTTECGQLSSNSTASPSFQT